MANDIAHVSAIELATGMAIAWLGNPNSRLTAEEVPGFFQAMHATVAALTERASNVTPVAKTDLPAPDTDQPPLTTAQKSLASSEYIVSFIDGKPYKMLRRHLTKHSLTPDEYRARYGLDADYPMVAEAYSMARRAVAKKIGLGRKPVPRRTRGPAVPAAPAAKAPRGRPRKNA
jgi:predicted transcriptional regulator